MPGMTLSWLKLDGRKRKDITDQGGQTISINASEAKKIFGEIKLERILFKDAFLVKGAFNGGKYLIIK